jgi:hypothetical protein
MSLNPNLTKLADLCASGQITKLGYFAKAIELLDLPDYAKVDRQWLADQLGLSYSATTQLLHRYKKMKGTSNEAKD